MPRLRVLSGRRVLHFAQMKAAPLRDANLCRIRAQAFFDSTQVNDEACIDPSFRLVHELTAVDIQGLSCDELGPFRGQKHHRSDQIFRLLLAVDGASRNP